MAINLNEIDYTNLLYESSLRFILWGLFIYYDKADPFVREIKAEEIWLYQYPVHESYIPARQLWIIIVLFPLIYFGTEYLITGDYADPWSAWLALSLAYPLNGFITSAIKNIVGRPRPDFVSRCFPDGNDLKDYTKCTGTLKDWMDGRKSFPSGHSSFAFTCMVFISLYMARKFELYEKDKRGQSWQLFLCVLPIMVALAIGVSRTCDYHHHYSDVIGGALLGTVLGYMCFKLYFPN